MKRVVLMIISALFCGVVLTNCKRAEQKVNLALASEDILVDREIDKIVSRDIADIEDIEKWIRDERQKRVSNIASEVVLADKEKDKIVSLDIADIEDIEKWIRDERQKRSNIVE